jgi:hypothetical protein
VGNDPCVRHKVRTVVSVLSMERGSTEGNLHLQGYAELRCTTLRCVMVNLRKECNLDSDPAGKYSISMKPLAGEGLHCRVGMIGYCLKDKTQPWFKNKMHGVTEDEVQRGEDLYIRLGKLTEEQSMLDVQEHPREGILVVAVSPRICVKKH